MLNHAKLPPIDYFYPRPPRGGRRSASSRLTAASGFLSTPSARRATKDAPVDSVELADFYPRPPRGGRRAAVAAVFRSDVISIHALREEGDVPQQRLGPVQQISIHALREEGDRGMRRGSPDLRNFYPRPPRGGRPHSSTVRLSGGAFLSTPSARRATPPQSARSRCSGISIHALREEGDPANPMCRSSTAQFLSTPSARRATSYSSC